MAITVEFAIFCIMVMTAVPWLLGTLMRKCICRRDTKNDDDNDNSVFWHE